MGEAWLRGIPLAMTGVAVAALASQRVRLDVIGWGVLAALGFSGVLSGPTLFAGFASAPVLVLLGMMVLGDALAASGAATAIARGLSLIAERGGPRCLQWGLLVVATVWSGFLSDVGLVTLLLPVLRQLHRRTAIPLRPLILPLAVAATWGGTLTMIGSSAMIAANGLLATTPGGALGLLAPLPVTGGLALWGIGWAALASRAIWGAAPPPTPLETGEAALRAYWMELTVTADFPWAGQPIGQVPSFGDHGVTVVGVYRGTVWMRASAATRLTPGDVVVVSGEPAALNALRHETPGVAAARSAMPEGGAAIAEVVIGPRSPWQHHTVWQLQLRRRYGVTVLGWFRDGGLQLQRLARQRLQVGDLLLVEGDPAVLATLPQAHGVLLLTVPHVGETGPLGRRWAVPGIVAATLAGTVAAGWPLPVALAGALALLGALGAIDLHRAYRAVSWHVLIFVAAFLALAQALARAGWLAVAAAAFQRLIPPAWPAVGIALVYGISAGVTQVLSDVPTVLLVGPWALTVAQLAHWPVAPFVLAPAIAVSTSPLLPTGNKTSLLVLEAGGYTRREFWMFGLPLTVGMGVLTTWGLTRG